jgi:hypothetical protein
MPIVQPGQISLPQFQPQPEGPGFGERMFGGISSGIAGVLMAMQQQKENEMRQQQMAQQAQYYSMLSQQAAAQVAQQAQVGGAIGAALGIGQPPPPVMMPQRGNQTQAMGSGIVPQQAANRPNLPPGVQGIVPNFGGGAQSQPGAFTEVLSGAVQGMGGAPGVQAIFQGVKPENMSAAVEGVQAVRQLTAPSKSTEPELPNSAKEFQFLQTLSPQQQQLYYSLIGPKPGNSVTVNTGGDVEKAYGVEGAKADVAARTEVVNAANAAARAFPSLDEGYQMLRKGTVVAGVGSKPILQVHRVLSSMGVKVSKEAVEDTQAASRLLYEGVAAQLAQRTFGSGTAVSDKDREASERMAGVDFTQDLGSLKKIARINVGLNIEKLIGATMQLDEQAQLHPEATKDLAVRKRGIENKLYGAQGSREKPTKGSIWGKYLDMLANEAAEEAKARGSIQGLGQQIFGGP